MLELTIMTLAIIKKEVNEKILTCCRTEEKKTNKYASKHLRQSPNSLP